MSLKWYRVIRESSKAYLREVKQAGYNTVCIKGDGDLAEVIYLSCLEARVQVKEELDGAYPVFRIENWNTVLDWPKKDAEQDR